MSVDEPTRTCPYCGEEMECDWVDIGVGSEQAGPYNCMECGASQIGPQDDPELSTPEERATGYYRGRVSPHANTVHGTLVDLDTASKLYKMGLLDKPKEKK